MLTIPRAAILLLSLAVACGGGASPASPAPDTSPTAAGAKPSPTLITHDELSAARVATAFEAVDRLRHAWLKDGLTGRAATVYWDDNQPIGGTDVLRDIPIQEVIEIRYLDGRASNQRWPGNTGGAIVVVKRRG